VDHRERFEREYNNRNYAPEALMTRTIIECVANYSEARRPQVVEAIAQAITSVPDVYLLDRHSDLDHNRTVLTFAGPSTAVEEAAFRSIARAAELIDLNQHTGEHPRIGATDVVPFVPVSGATMQDCVEVARRLGRRVGEELGIPVYLYEEAATRPERRNLEDIRRGQFETLKDEIASHPERAPDFGPRQLGPAGATVIGARHPLIAYNVYLATDDVSIASQVAKAVRHSSGGLRYVKGLGMLVDGRAQVSMNLTNFRQTPLARVVEMVRREAARFGTSIHHSELVGLIPEDALVEAAQWYLQLDQFHPDQILERRLQAALQGAAGASGLSHQAADFLEALASESPTPGGGSASAYSAATGAALVAMVARLTLKKKGYAQVAEQMRMALEQAEKLRTELTADIQQDAEAFSMVMTALRLARTTPEEQTERQEVIRKALMRAAEVPLGVARRAVQVMELALLVVSQGNRNAISDGATAAALARAALAGAGYNVQINLAELRDEPSGRVMLEELSRLETRAGFLEEQIRSQLAERGSQQPV